MDNMKWFLFGYMPQIGEIDVNSLGWFEQQWHKRIVHRQERAKERKEKIRPLDTHDDKHFTHNKLF